MLLIKGWVVVAIVFMVAGCATSVKGREEVLGQSDVQAKECYVFDTLGRSMGRNAPASVGLGILGGLFPPLMLLTAASSAALTAADKATLPAKCGLTFDEALQELAATSFNEDAITTAEQKAGGLWMQLQPKFGNRRCAIHELTVINTTTSGKKKLVEKIEICKNEEGEPVVTQQGVSEAYLKSFQEKLSAYSKP